MTDDSNEPLLPFSDADGATPPARKRATKKTAAKKVAAINADSDLVAEAKPAAKKAARKTAAKKAVAAEPEAEAAPVVKKAAAKKTARKKASETETEATTTPAVEIPAAAEAPAIKKKTAARKTAKIKPPAGETAPASPSEAPPVREASAVAEAPQEHAPAADESQPRRFGRVPGGGPIKREVQEQAPAPEMPPARKETAGQPAQEGAGRESRSKRRREKRKQRMRERRAGAEAEGGHSEPQQQERRFQLNSPKVEVNGMLELAPKGFGFLRVAHKNFEQARDDVFVPPEMVRRFGLRLGQWIHGLAQEGPRGPQLVEITSINGLAPDDSRNLPHFEELKAINPNKRISFETTPERFTTRVLDLAAPVGRGQRGLIVSPPRSGKTTLLLHLAEAVREKYDEALHLMVLLVDERPEEVTEFRRALPGAEIYASSNDDGARNHCRIAELAIERAKRLVEAGKDVFLLMDSITRLARAYNHTMSSHGGRGRGTGTGGIMVGALEIPRRLFAAARNTRGGGSLTILATALVQTNSRADEAIFQEFKGTGNMELVLDRKIAENYIYPAVDLFKSGTRREELLLPEHMLHKIHLIRRGLSGHRPVEAMERLIFFLKKFSNNPQMLLEIKG